MIKATLFTSDRLTVALHCVIQFVLGLLIFIGDDVRPTSTAMVADAVFGGKANGWFFMGAAVLATGFYMSFVSPVMRLCVLFPQAFIVISSAIGAVIAISTATYPDGTRCCTSLYIAEDQIVWVILAIFYFIALARIVKWR